jgi:hypothetical protein
MEAKRAVRNLAGIQVKYTKLAAAVEIVALSRPDEWDLESPGGAVKKDALARKLDKLGDRLRELLGAVEETAAIIRR